MGDRTTALARSVSRGSRSQRSSSCPALTRSLSFTRTETTRAEISALTSTVVRGCAVPVAVTWTTMSPTLAGSVIQSGGGSG